MPPALYKYVADTNFKSKWGSWPASEISEARLLIVNGWSCKLHLTRLHCTALSIYIKPIFVLSSMNYVILAFFLMYETGTMYWNVWYDSQFPFLVIWHKGTQTSHYVISRYLRQDDLGLVIVCIILVIDDWSEIFRNKRNVSCFGWQCLTSEDNVVNLIIHKKY